MPPGEPYTRETHAAQPTQFTAFLLDNGDDVYLVSKGTDVALYLGATEYVPE